MRIISYLGKIIIIPPSTYQNCVSLRAFPVDIQSYFNFPNTSVWHQRCHIYLLYTNYIVFASGILSSTSV